MSITYLLLDYMHVRRYDRNTHKPLISEHDVKQNTIQSDESYMFLDYARCGILEICRISLQVGLFDAK